jgi:hypothetical protein
MLDSCILVKSYGDGESLLGQLALDRDVDGTKQLFTSDLGPTDESQTMYASVTTANYYMDYTS